MSTLETYEYPVILREPDDDKDSDTSSVKHLCSPGGQLMTRDSERGRRELSAIREGSEDGISVGRTTEEHFTEFGNEYTEKEKLEISEYPGYITQDEEDGHDAMWRNPTIVPYPLDDGDAVIESNGYVMDAQTDLPHYDTLLSNGEACSGGYVEDSCTDSERRLESVHVVETDEHPAEMTHLEPNSDDPPTTLDQTQQTSHLQTHSMMTEEYALNNEAPVDSGISLGMLDTETNVSSLASFPTHVKTTTLNDGYIRSNTSTTSSGYGSEAGTSGYKLSISSYTTDTSAAPSSCYIPSNISTTSSGYVSESGFSGYKYGSLCSELSCDTPHMPHFGRGWTHDDGVTDVGLCESPISHPEKTSELSGYVAESLETVPSQPLRKHPILHGKVSVDSLLCAGTPDSCTDGVFNDDQLTTGHSSITDDLSSKDVSDEYSKESCGDTSGYVPYPGRGESDAKDRFALTDNLTSDCDVSTTHHSTDAGTTDPHSLTSSNDTANLSYTVMAGEGEDHNDTSLSYLASHNGKTAYTDCGATTQHLKSSDSTELFPSHLNSRSGYIDSSQLQAQSTVHVPECTHVPAESTQC